MPTLALPKGRTRASLLWRDRRHAGGGKHSPASGGSRSGFASTRPVPVGTRPPTQRSSRSASSGRPMASAETPPRSACQKTCGWRAATTSGLECSSRARTGEFRIPASEFGIVRCAGPSSYYCMPHATRTRRWHGSRGSVDTVTVCCQRHPATLPTVTPLPLTVTPAQAGVHAPPPADGCPIGSGMTIQGPAVTRLSLCL